MYDIKNLTNEVQYLFFRSGKDCFLAGKASLQGLRDSEITPVIKKMEQRKIIHLHEVTGGAVSSSQKPDEAETTKEKADTEKKAVSKEEADAEEKAEAGEKAKPKSTTRGKK